MRSLFQSGCLRLIALRVLLAGLGVMVASAAYAEGKVLHGSAADYRRLLHTLSPGDTLLLQAGVYERGLPVHRLNGTKDSPITIAGPSLGARAVFWGQPGSNVVSIVDSSHVVIKNLAIDGRGAFVDGVKAEGHSKFAHHITLENLTIRDLGQHQQIVGVSTKCPAWGWVIRGNMIIGAGTGMYLGNSDGSAPFFDGLIEHNLVIDTLGYNLQIKHQLARPDNAPEAVRGGTTIVRHNVFSKARNASIGPAARPNVLVGHWPLSGPGADDVYQIYGNLFYQNPTEALFQGEGNIALYDNLFINIYDNGFPAIAVQRHNDIPRLIRVFHNTVVSPRVGIKVTEGAVSYTQSVTANAVFAAIPLIGGLQQGNVVDGYEAAREYFINPRGDIGSVDLYPKPGKLRGIRIDREGLASFVDADRDFNGDKRKGYYRGAYAGSGTNPGWRLALERKPALQ